MTLPARLSEHDAWEIALAWREQLQGCVRLEIDADGGAFRAVDSFEWVTFMFHGARDDGFEQVAEPVDAARCARAASVAWFALSCCSGFSGTENPRFWRRVFSELHAPKGHQVIFRRPRAQIHITDAVRFFDHPERPFPRVRIEPSQQQKEECLRAFLGCALDAQPEDEASPIDSFLSKLGEFLSFTNAPRRLSAAELNARLRTHGARLDGILEKLAPFIRRSHWRRRLPMGISRVDAADLAWILPGLGFERDHNGLHYDQLKLDSVFLRDDEAHLETAVRSLLTKTRVTIVLPKVALPRFSSNTSGQISSLLVPPHGSGCEGRLKVGTLTTVCPHETTFTALCSSLPHSRLIKAVRLDVKSSHISTIIGLRATEWAWLGYAFFHPDAARDSVFAQLDLDQYRIVDNKVEILRRMARGNNLFTVDQDEAAAGALPLSDYYHEGKVRVGTVVYATPEVSAAKLLTFSNEAWLTLWIGSGHFYNLGPWVCAVVPGCGLGWISRKSILQIKSRPPGPSCLRGLRVNVESAFGGLGPLLQLLSIIGERLEYLHIVGRRNPLDASSVAAILRMCPALISLRICHDGSFWSGIETSEAAKMPQLRELELVVGSYQHLPVLSPLRSPLLNDLEVLRVVTLAKTSFAANRSTFVDVLARYPQLAYANWSLGWSHTGCSPLRSYDEHQTASMTRFGDLHDAVDAFVERPMCVSSRLAFLSVIYHELTANNHSVSPLSRFGRDVVAMIFAFATTRTPRDLYVDDEVEFVTGHVRN